MTAMLSTRYLLLALLALMSSGRTAGKMTCWDWVDGDWSPQDPDKCWAPDINGIFGGNLDGCSGDIVSIRYRVVELRVPVQSPCIAD